MGPQSVCRFSLYCTAGRGTSYELYFVEHFVFFFRKHGPLFLLVILLSLGTSIHILSSNPKVELSLDFLTIVKSKDNGDVTNLNNTNVLDIIYM